MSIADKELESLRYRDTAAVTWRAPPGGGNGSAGRNYKRGRSMGVTRTLTVLAFFLTLLPVSASGAQQAYPSARHGGGYSHNYYLPPAPSSTPWYPAWHPDGDRITVALSGSIWDVDPDAGVATEITYAPDEYHSSPDWSPDGRWLVYTADDGGRTIQLRVLDTVTGDTNILTEDEFLYLDPTFSPSGDHLAYVSNKANGYYNVYVRPMRDGQWAGDEMAITRDREYPSDRLYFGSWDMHITPAWTPDGQNLLLVSNRGVALGSGNVWRVPVRENGMDEAVPVLIEQTLYRTRPHVSIDGQRFVYSSTAGTADQFNNLYIQPVDGGYPYKLTFFQHDAFHPRWSADGEWIAYIDNRDGLPQLAVLETYGGSNRVIQILERRWKREVGTLEVRVAEAGDVDVTEARIHLTASDGKFYAPAGAYARIGRANDPAFHTGGRFSLELPPGPAELVAVKGFEYSPASDTVEIEAGRTTEVTLELDRLVDLSEDDWYSGSTHVHMNYAGNFHNTLENLKFMSAAEDQDVVVELIANKDNRVLDQHVFEPGGGAHSASTADRIVHVGEEYRPDFYGHVFMLGLSSHLISPFTTGYEDSGVASLYPSNTDMLRKAKAQGAFTGYVHPFSGDDDPLEAELGRAKGFLMDVALGTADALEWSFPNRAGFFPLYAAWNNGFPIVATGGEDSISDLHRYYAVVGAERTYVQVEDGPLSWDGWISGLRQGRAFVTNGPLIELTIDGKRPGESLELPEGGREIELHAAIRSIVPLRTLLVIHNGEVIDRVDVQLVDGRFDYRGSYRPSESGWYHVRVEGEPEDRFPLDTTYPHAFTNPVWVRVGGRPIRSVEAAEYGLRWLDELEAQADAWPWWRSEEERSHVAGQIEEAREVYRGRLNEARGGS